MRAALCTLGLRVEQLRLLPGQPAPQPSRSHSAAATFRVLASGAVSRAVPRTPGAGG